MMEKDGGIVLPVLDKMASHNSQEMSRKEERWSRRSSFSVEQVD